MKVAVNNAIDLAKASDHVAVKTGEVESSGQECLSDGDPLNEFIPVTVSEADATARDLNDPVTRQGNPGLPVVITLHRDDRRDPLEFGEHRKVGDISSVKDQLASEKRVGDTRRERREHLSNVGVGDDADRRDNRIATRTGGRQGDLGGSPGVRGGSRQEGPRRRLR